MKNFDDLRDDRDWPDVPNKVYVADVRWFLSETRYGKRTRPIDELLLESLRTDKFLLIHGPRHSGKRTLALAVAKKWSETKYGGLVKLLWQDCSDITSLPPSVLRQLKIENSKDEDCLCVLADCDFLLPELGNEWQGFLRELQRVHVLFTLSRYAEELQTDEFFTWADRTEKKALQWSADTDFLKALLSAAGKYKDDPELREEVRKHFHTTFQGGMGSANLTQVRLFLDSKFDRIDEWLLSRAVPVEPPAPNLALITELSQLVRSEISRVDQICEATSGKNLQQIFVPRVYLDLASQPGLLGQADVQLSEDGEKHKKWDEVIENGGVITILANAGYGKTISLLEEVRTRCLFAKQRLEQPNPLEALELAFYVDASELAELLSRQTLSLVDVVISLIGAKHGVQSNAVEEFIRARIEEGRVLLAIDALDEIADEIVVAGLSRKPKDVLRDRLLAYIRRDKVPPVLLSSRRIGYTSTFLPSREWLLLPFTEPQVSVAVRQWSVGVTGLLEAFDQMRQTPPLRELLQIPVLLMLVAHLSEEAVRNGQQVPHMKRRSDFYKKSLYLFQSRWIDRMNRKGKNPTRSQQDQFLPFVEEFASRLWQTDPRRSHFSPLEISREIESVQNYPALRTRDVLQDVCESGLLTRAEKKVSDSPYSFLHRTLLEYLAARYLARSVVEAQRTLSAVPGIQKYYENPDTYIVLWMLAGYLENPGPFIADLTHWAKYQLSESINPRFYSPNVAPILVDCVFECETEAVDLAVRLEVWSIATRALEAMQKRVRRKSMLWGWFADWSFVYRLLRAIELNEGAISGADTIRTLLEELKGVRLQKGGVLPEGVVLHAEASIRFGLTSKVSSVRWISIFTLGAFHQLGKQEVSKVFVKELPSILHKDPDPYVRSVAARALAHIDSSQALPILKSAIFRDCNVTASGAAFAIANIRPVNHEVVDILKHRTNILLEDPAADPSLLSTLIGALENLVNEMWEAEKTQKVISGELTLQLENEMPKIFIQALDQSALRIKSSAANALGKLHHLDAWQPLIALFDSLDSNDINSRNLRASVCFALQQLSSRVDEEYLSPGVELFVQLVRDSKEIWQVRRPAASALGDIVRRGYRSEELLETLISGTKDQDKLVSQSCLFSLLRIDDEVTFDCLREFVLGFPNRRNVLCQVISNHPSRTGLRILDYLIENENRPPVLVAALSALQRVCDRAERLRKKDSRFPYFATDVILLEGLAERCVELLRRQQPPSVLAIGQSTGLSLFKLLLSSRSKNKDHLKSRFREVARRLIDYEEDEVAGCAWYLLGSVGDSSDLHLLEAKKRSMSSNVIATAEKSMDFLANRLK